jgi:hypothetical protein
MRGGERKMKKILFVMMALCFVSTLALAEEAVKPVDNSVVAPVATTAVVAGDEKVITTDTILTAEPVKEAVAEVK